MNLYRLSYLLGILPNLSSGVLNTISACSRGGAFELHEDGWLMAEALFSTLVLRD